MILKPDIFFSYLISFLPFWQSRPDFISLMPGMWHSYFLAQEVATANLHETALIFHAEVLVFALLKKTGAYHMRHLG